MDDETIWRCIVCGEKIPQGRPHHCAHVSRRELPQYVDPGWKMDRRPSDGKYGRKWGNK